MDNDTISNSWINTKIKALLQEKSISYQTAAKALDLTYGSFTTKLSKMKFTITELVSIVDLFNGKVIVENDGGRRVIVFSNELKDLKSIMKAFLLKSELDYHKSAEILSMQYASFVNKINQKDFAIVDIIKLSSACNAALVVITADNEPLARFTNK